MLMNYPPVPETIPSFFTKPKHASASRVLPSIPHSNVGRDQVVTVIHNISSKSYPHPTTFQVPGYGAIFSSFSRPPVKALSRPTNFEPFLSSNASLTTSRLGLPTPVLRLPSRSEKLFLGDSLIGLPFDDTRESTEELDPRCLRFFSNSSISERMLKNSSFEVGVCWSSSGPVAGDPSMNFEGRRAPFWVGDDVCEDILVGFGAVFVAVFLFVCGSRGCVLGECWVSEIFIRCPTMYCFVLFIRSGTYGTFNMRRNKDAFVCIDRKSVV